MLGLIKNGEKHPYISLNDFVDVSLLDDALVELEDYRLKQTNERYLRFISYRGSDWNTNREFQKKQIEALPKTFKYISSFCKEIVPFNILWSNHNDNILLLHRDSNPDSMPFSPWNSLVDNYKNKLNNSYYDLIKDFSEFKITKSYDEINEKFNGLDFDYEGFLKEKHKENYNDILKSKYKLHLVLSPTKSLFIYDNVTDLIHPINAKACLFNSMDFHDSYKDSWGYSIQFPMSPNFLKDEIKDYCEIKNNKCI
jgi:hypothetical protein